MRLNAAHMCVFIKVSANYEFTWTFHHPFFQVTRHVMSSEFNNLQCLIYRVKRGICLCFFIKHYFCREIILRWEKKRCIHEGTRLTTKFTYNVQRIKYNEACTVYDIFHSMFFHENIFQWKIMSVVFLTQKMSSSKRK